MPRILRPSLKNLEGRKELVGAEIGVFLGANSETILQNLDIKKLYLVDPYHEGYCIFKIAGYKSFMAKEEAHKRLTPYENKIVWGSRILQMPECIILMMFLILYTLMEIINMMEL